MRTIPQAGRAEHNICGVLVHVLPDKQSVLVEQLSAFDGVEVHLSGAGGRIVTTIEDTPATSAIDTLSAIHRLDGIIAAGLVYHHFEPAQTSLAADAEDSL